MLISLMMIYYLTKCPYGMTCIDIPITCKQSIEKSLRVRLIASEDFYENCAN